VRFRVNRRYRKFLGRVAKRKPILCLNLLGTKVQSTRWVQDKRHISGKSLAKWRSTDLVNAVYSEKHSTRQNVFSDIGRFISLYTVRLESRDFRSAKYVHISGLARSR
jgi:hypothetical protein